MLPNEYARLSKRTLAKLENLQLDNYHMVLGIVTEAGEIADIFKKELAYSREVDWVHLAEEIGDLMFYVAGLCTTNDLDLENILKVNIEKLRTRYPEKFTEELANNRNLEKEKEVLEGGIISKPAQIEFDFDTKDFD